MNSKNGPDWTYGAHVRPFHIEEPVDYLFYRPLAYMTIRLTYSLPLTPNHFSLIGFILALFTCWQLSLGTTQSYFVAGVGILLFGIVDCCDGMIVRLKKNGSELGEQIDMFVDALASILFFSGLLYGQITINNNLIVLVLLFLLLPTLLLHTSLYNYYKKQYLFALKGHVSFDEKQRGQLKRKGREYSKTGGHYFERLLIFLYLKFNTAQTSCFHTQTITGPKYTDIQRRMLPLWSLIAGSTHLTVLAICLMFDRPLLGLSIIVIFGNLWLLAIFSIQQSVFKAMGEA